MARHGDPAKLSGEEKVHILQAGLRSDRSRKKSCDRYGLSEEQFKEWRDQFAKAGRKVLAKAEHNATPAGKALAVDTKVAIVLQGMKEGSDVAAVCKQHRVSTRDYQIWRKVMSEAGKKALAAGAAKGDFSFAALKVPALLMLVIILAIVFAVSRVASSNVPQPPKEVLERRARELARSVTRYDSKTGKPITKTAGEWKELRAWTGVWKHPETQEAVIVAEIPCMACKAKIPAPFVPQAASRSAVGADEHMMDYKCPKCEKSPFRP